MRGVLPLCLATCVLGTTFAQTPALLQPDPEDQSIAAFLRVVESAMLASDRHAWMGLLSPLADAREGGDFFDGVAPAGVTRAVVKERDRSDLAGSLPGEGYRLIADVFLESVNVGRILTWRLDIRRPRGQDLGTQPWRVVSMERLSSIEGLHRLGLDPDTQYSARDLRLRAVDFEIRLPAGQVFVARTSEGITALVLMGDGSFFFSPTPKEERGQVRLFSGAEQMDAAFTAAFIRISPFVFESVVKESMLVPEAGRDARVWRRAQEIFGEEVGNTFSLDLSDLSRDTWSLLPQPGDFVAEMRTRRFDRLTYARSGSEPEDVSLFQRRRGRNISVYASEQRLATRGPFYDESDLADYDIVDYTVDATISPEREWLEGRTELRLKVRSYVLATVTFKLAESLTVNSVVSRELGRLMFLRVRNQNSIVVNLPTPVARDEDLTFTIGYQGRITRQRIDDEAVAVPAGEQAARAAQRPDEVPIVPPEPNWLLSNRAQWYPQGQVSDFATATLRVTVPAEFAVVGSGVPAMQNPTIVQPATNGQSGLALYEFTARQPVRYLSFVVSRMLRADAATVALDIVPGPAVVRPDPSVLPIGSRNTVELRVDANRRQENRGRDLLPTMAEILRLYAGLVGDAPYESLTVAMVENDVPGGHAPGYAAVMNNPPPTTPFTWRNDPAAFSGFPEFFLAHEIAHQWFGQAVGWKNYHEQWLSEGFAQYFAALYARERRGDAAFRDILRQFRRWALDASDQGPVYLGYRLGHIKSEPRVFRALVYNKGAAVLHMLRRLIGDEAFFSGIRRYYAERRYKKAGTDDLRKAMEAASGRDLSRFFARWIFDVEIPRLRYYSSVSGQEVLVRIEQTGSIFDLPVTVTIQYADGRTVDEVVFITSARVEARLPVTGTVRGIELNQDNAALAYFDRSGR
jgi:hypothetical protein